MYLCNDCDQKFERTERCGRESGEFWGVPFTEYYDGCPCCKSENISEIKDYCHICDCEICEGDIYYEIADGTIACENCVNKKEA